MFSRCWPNRHLRIVAQKLAQSGCFDCCHCLLAHPRFRGGFNDCVTLGGGDNVARTETEPVLQAARIKGRSELGLDLLRNEVGITRLSDNLEIALGLFKPLPEFALQIQMCVFWIMPLVCKIFD